MGATGESPADSTQYINDDLQGMADFFATLALRVALGDPWIPMPEIMGVSVWAGLLRHRGGIFEPFRGRLIPKKMGGCANVLRMVAPRDETMGLPISGALPDDGAVGLTAPPCDVYLRWRSPLVAAEKQLFAEKIVLMNAGGFC